MAPSTSGAPTFPTFLLPSFTLPFRRRRAISPSGSRGSDARSPIDTKSSPVPSLSSSPTSTLSDIDPASPSELDSFSAPLGWISPHDQDKSPVNGAVTGTLHRPHPDTIRCRGCATDLAFGAQIVSKGFTGRYGRAFLVSPPSSLSTTPVDLGLATRPYGISRRDLEDLDDSELLNIKIGRRENRQLVTGAHVVADISCAVCGIKVGWKYVEATEPAQKYKEGKFILETERVVAFRSWEDAGLDDIRDSAYAASEGRRMSLSKSVSSESGGNMGIAEMRQSEENELDRAVTFDSEDEDELEDIFSGTWDPAVVVKRRRTKISRLKGKRANAA